MLDILITRISNLSGGRSHYEKLNHDIMLVLKKFKCHLLSFTRRYQTFVALSSMS
jgi:hypothetical protein